MQKMMTCFFVLWGLGFQAQAAELSPGNIIGKYKVSTNVGFQKIFLNFNVLSTNEFEIQRVFRNGRLDELCNGNFTMNTTFAWYIEDFTVRKVFKGNFTCPSDRTRNIDFNIDFKNRTTEDLNNGTTVTVRSSLAPNYTLNAYVKRL